MYVVYINRPAICLICSAADANDTQTESVQDGGLAVGFKYK